MRIRADAAKTCSTRRARSRSPHPDVMGYHDYHQIPNYWSLRPPLRAAGSLLCVRRRLEPAGPRGAGVRLVSPLHVDHRPDELPARRPDQTGQVHYRARPAGLSVDGSDLAAVSPRRELGATTSRLGTQPDCNFGIMGCHFRPQNAQTPSIWNPLPRFTDVQQTTPGEPRAGHRAAVSRRPAPGRLPAVSWVDPQRYGHSEHPPASITRRPGMGDQRDQRGHAQQGLAVDARSS